jgi:cytochrome b6-f complex iron-sulfur subunit
MSTDSATRRHFLKVVAHGGALVGAASLGFGCSSGGPAVAGNVSSLSVGSLITVASDSLALGRDAQGVYAMTLICPHANCDMSSQGSVSASGVLCNCHGSRFDANGAVLQGPAQTALEHYLVTIDTAGQITVDTSQVVSASTRVAVA